MYTLLVLCCFFLHVSTAANIGNGEARLVGGAGPWEGTVEIYHNGVWGTICDRGFDMKDARVVCRMLGFSREIQYFPSAHFGQGNGTSLITYASCAGNEQNIGACGYQDSSCSHSYDVGVSCLSTERQQTTQGVRLIGGTGPYEGTVELLVNGRWGTICDYNFDIKDADVICQMAGYPRAIQAFSKAHFGHGNGTSMLYNLHCNGHEDSLDYCGSTGWYKSTCTHDQDAGVACLNSKRTYTSEGARLVGGEGPWEGTIEVIVNGQWGTVCDYNFDMKDADVLCRMSGFSGALQFFPGAHFGHGNGTIMLSNLQCSGHEDRVDSCGSDGWYKPYTYCTHNRDAGVVCHRTSDKVSTEGIQLVGGTGPYEGRIELNINGQWGTVCGTGFDLNDGEVICKMAGFSRALQVFNTAKFGEGKGRVYLENLQCTGHEKHVDSCATSGLFQTTCRHNNDAGVACLSGNSSEVAQAVRLVGGFRPHEGRVELLVNGQWGTICDSSFDIPDATVICGMLGYSGKIKVFNDAYFGRGTGPVLMDGLSCIGHEQHIDSCKSNGWYKTSCGHDDDAGLSCNADNSPAFG